MCHEKVLLMDAFMYKTCFVLGFKNVEITVNNARKNTMCMGL